MTNEEILDKLQGVFRNIFDDDSIVLTAATTADDIEEWDSLNQIKIILACEQVFKTKLNARKINTLENVGQMIDYLADALKQPS
jgi:acyl carrier protein